VAESIGPAAVYAQGGTIRYVAPGGSDLNNDCTASATPCATVQHAVDVAGPYDEIRVATGLYTGVQSRPAPSGYSGAAVVTQVVYISETVTVRGGYNASFSAWDPDLYPAMLDAQGQGRVLFVADGVTPTIEGMHITGGDATDLGDTSRDWGGGVYVYRGTVTISNTVVYSNVACSDGGNGDGGGLYAETGDVTLLHNLFYSNTASLANQGNGGAAAFSSGYATLISNTIRDNVAGVQSSRGGGL
jgi:hypothetical protein